LNSVQLNVTRLLMLIIFFLSVIYLNF